ncbi:MAG: glycosyltransferase family 9 protein [Sulfurospirillaceae bacterium]|nr:glycosyltransferase family 9 protein [Sulfurospirillaceae bacterium]
MNISKILIIIRRSNGDVFLSSALINALHEHYQNPKIDLLVDEGTLAIAKTLKHINEILVFSHDKKNSLSQDLSIIRRIYKKYDLCISLTATDRNILYAVLASKISISAVDPENKKSWWKKVLLSKFYKFDLRRHMIYNTLEPLKLLGINIKSYDYAPHIDEDKCKKTLLKFGLQSDDYMIFHPSAQFIFRTYPIKNINTLLEKLVTLNIKIVITGGNDAINHNISEALVQHDKILNLITKTSLQELYHLISQCKVHIGMDTLNTHIAASFDKHLIAIYGPNGVTQWSPFNAKLAYAPSVDTPPLTKYGNFTIIQADMPCVPCNQNGCKGLGKSECLENITPEIIFDEVKNCLTK